MKHPSIGVACPIVSSIERMMLVNMLHVSSSICLDLMLSIEVSIISGRWKMYWEQHQFPDARRLATLLPELDAVVEEILTRIDFDAVDRAVAKTLAESGSGLPGESQFCRLVFVMLLCFFQLFNAGNCLGAAGYEVRTHLAPRANSSPGPVRLP